MNFNLTEEQELLQASCREFMKRNYSPRRVQQLADDQQGPSAELWRQLADLGWIGLLIPAQYGGSDGRLADLTVLAQEMGKFLFEAPFLSTVVGADVILHGATEDQKRNWLPEICKGKRSIALGLGEPDVDYDMGCIATTAAPADDAFVISGRKLFVRHANAVDAVLCAARTAAIDRVSKKGITLFLIDPTAPGVQCIALQTGAKDKQFELILENARVSPENVVGVIDLGWPLLEAALAKATVAQCAEMLGVARRVFEMTVEYAQQRVQFNRPIGSFQAIQHHCANMMIQLQTAELMTHKAAWTIDRDLPHTKEIARAKAWTNASCNKVGALGHQIHGGMGFALEHDLHLYTRRIRASEYAFGDSDWHYERLAEDL